MWGTGFLTCVSELRLKKACHFLREGRQKIIDIALESGFGSLAHFNYAFKRRFGMTPTEWRERNAPQPRRSPIKCRQAACRRVGGAAVLVLMRLPVAGMAVPEAGVVSANQNPNVATTTATTTNPPATKTPATNVPAQSPQQFRVNQYEAKGNTLLSSNVLYKVLSPYTGESVDLDTVKKAWAALRLEYKDRGYPTVGVVLPPQKVTNGVIFFEVTEGTLADLRVLHNRFFSSNNVMRALPGLRFGPDTPILNGKVFQAQVDRANSNPDRQISPEMEPGPDPGTTALVLDVKDRLPLHARVDWDDYSPPGTPPQRVNANASYDNLWQLEHSVGFQYGFSPERMKESLDVPRLPLCPVDWPEISYYSAFYRAPLGPSESVEEQIARDKTHFGYNETTRQFVAPPATGRPELLFYGSRSTTENSVPGGPLEHVVTNSPLLAIQPAGLSRISIDGSNDRGRTIHGPIAGSGRNSIRRQLRSGLQAVQDGDSGDQRFF